MVVAAKGWIVGGRLRVVGQVVPLGPSDGPGGDADPCGVDAEGKLTRSNCNILLTFITRYIRLENKLIGQSM